MADKNRVVYGFSNVHIAFFSEDSVDGAPKWDQPIPIPGAVSFEPEADTSPYDFFADNMKYFSSFSDNGYAGKLVVAKFPESILAGIFGWVMDAVTGGLLEITDGIHKNFALLAQAEGDKMGRRLVFYNCSGGKPSQSMSTTEENMEVKTQSMDISVSPIKLSSGYTAAKFAIANDLDTPEAATVYGSFFDAVYVPAVAAP